MDLYAYKQIENLQAIADRNGISVPRCRGYRLMRNEEPATPEDIAQMIEWETLYLAERQIVRVFQSIPCPTMRSVRLA